MVAGGSGLVGSELLHLLSGSPAYRRIVAPLRRPEPLDATIVLSPIVNGCFDASSWDGVTDAFCCLGTTRAAAGSAVAFERVDRELVVEFARTALKCGAVRFIVVSAVGAAPDARGHYLRVKALMERDVAALGFDAVHILRPSLLLGERRGKRPLERLAQRLAPVFEPLLVGRLIRYRPVAAADVAAAMLAVALRDTGGVQIHHLPLDGDRRLRVG